MQSPSPLKIQDSYQQERARHKLADYIFLNWQLIIMYVFGSKNI